MILVKGHTVGVEHELRHKEHNPRQVLRELLQDIARDDEAGHVYVTAKVAVLDGRDGAGKALRRFHKTRYRIACAGAREAQQALATGGDCLANTAQALGIGDLWPLMEKEEPNIVANLGNYYPSMAQDAVLHQRQTEISVLNGAIARYGERLGVPTPFNTVITKVISCIQNNYDKQYLG